MAEDHSPNAGHAHDDIDWAAHAATLAVWDDLERGRNRDIVAWIGVRPGETAVDVGSGAGGMAAAMLDAVGEAGTVVLVDGSPELLSFARRRVERPGYHVVPVHADLEQLRLDEVLDRRPVDVVHAGAVVHHLDDELATLRGFVAAVRPGGRIAIGEGGLGHRFLPSDCGVGDPGLEQRIAVTQEEWFWEHVRPAGATVRTGRGWNVLLEEAGLVDVTSRTFLLDLPPPLSSPARTVVRRTLEGQLARFGDRLGPSDRKAVEALLDDESPLGVMQRPDVFVLDARTIHLGRVP